MRWPIWRPAAGVDPETFAALYAGLASPEVRQSLARDAQGRLTYKNKVIRMYPIARLKQAFLERDRLAGIEVMKRNSAYLRKRQ